MTNTEKIHAEIERQIDAVCLALKYSCSNIELYAGYRDALTDIKTLINSLPKETPQGWISVKDSLPEETGFYFTCINMQGIPQCVGVTYFDATRRGGEWIEDDEDNCIANVDCWMPIPKFKEE